LMSYFFFFVQAASNSAAAIDSPADRFCIVHIYLFTSSFSSSKNYPSLLGLSIFYGISFINSFTFYLYR